MIYLLLTEFKDRTVSYGQSFFLRSAQAINQRENTSSVTYSTDLENEVSKYRLLHIMCGCQRDKAVNKNDTREGI